MTTPVRKAAPKYLPKVDDLVRILPPSTFRGRVVRVVQVSAHHAVVWIPSSDPNQDQGVDVPFWPGEYEPVLSSEETVSEETVNGEVMTLTREFHGPRPEIVCLCGSTRFIDEWNHWRRVLTEDGKIVLAIEVVTTQSQEVDPQYSDHELKSRLDELHKRKIDLADNVFVLNVGGYIGQSTRGEIEYAKRHGKLIKYLEPDDVE